MSCNTFIYIIELPSISNITVKDTGTTFITISWNNTSVGSANYTIITYSTDDVMISSNDTDDTNYTINGLTSGTSYRISVVPSDELCQGIGEQMMAETNGTSTTVGKQMCIV